MNTENNTVRKTKLFEKITKTPFLYAPKEYISELPGTIQQSREDIIWVTNMLYYIMS